MRRVVSAGLSVAVALAVMVTAPGNASAANASVERRVEPVVLTGAQLPRWSRLPAEGVADPHNPSSNVATRTTGR